ncbi:adenylate/guanylate cyclase domain-containing protein [Ideonella paludis]|uniref:Adenylate/guanylate cyclase domain-containing protein n=1 Tax=Ideonella paludis TaxID=1233411 RepID=A0ABS5DTI8_9BURK|nr:adenylate/guanylate cyclase domain-containing protein [Ideonella paludis]
MVQDVLPAHQGTLVQRRGDGLMLEFESVTGAAAAAFECHRRADAANQGRPGDQHIVLRMGLHHAEVLADGIDLYGAGVQLTHRLAALAQPGETLCTAEVRDELTDGLHASVCDKGERLLPGQDDPVRVYQLQPVGDAPRNLLRWAPESLLPRVAFVAAQNYANPDWNTVCQLVVTELTAAASRVTSWRVISALSTRRLTAQGLQQLDAQGEQRLADYVVQVAWGHSDSTPVISLRCTDVRRQQAIWQQDMAAPPQAWVASQEGLAADMARDLATTLLAREVRIAHDSALHSLPGYALLLAAVGLIHQTTKSASEKASQILEHLAQRHPRCAEVLFSLGNLFFLSGIHGFLPLDRVPTTSLNYLSSAIDVDNEHAGSLGLKRHITELFRIPTDSDPFTASQLTQIFPNDGDVWYYASCSEVDPSSAQPTFSINCAHIAIEVSPLDPQLPLRQTSLAFAHFRANQIEDALHQAKEAVRLNGSHLPAMALLIACHWESGDLDSAKYFANKYMTLRPSACVQAFVKHRTSEQNTLTQRIATALYKSGMPFD